MLAYIRADVDVTSVVEGVVVQHLLDFIYEHTNEEHLYCVVNCPEGELEIMWQRRGDAGHWQLRPHRCEGPWQLVKRERLLHSLATRRADTARLERELNSIVSAHIVLAHMVLDAAREILGKDAVRRAVHGHIDFANELQRVVARLTAESRPSLTIVSGGGAQTEARSGHLTLVP